MYDHPSAKPHHYWQISGPAKADRSNQGKCQFDISCNPGSYPAATASSKGSVRSDNAGLGVWERLSSSLKPGDLLVSETGTAQFGVLSTRLPSGSSHWTQAVWGSIGYATGAAVGASIGAKETGKLKRLLLLTGEGLLQMTIQAFSLLNRHGIVPVVFIFNNAGYTAERYFRGWEAIYNDVPDWDYGKIFSGLSPDFGARGYKITTRHDLDALLGDPEVQNATYPQVIDFALTKDDTPTPLKWGFEGKKHG